MFVLSLCVPARLGHYAGLRREREGLAAFRGALAAAPKRSVWSSALAGLDVSSLGQRSAGARNAIFNSRDALQQPD